MVSSRENAVTVLFDSNFLMTAARLHFDVFQRVEEALGSRFEPKIASANLAELRVLSEKAAIIPRRQARVALKLAEQCRVVEAGAQGRDPDEVVLNFAKASSGIIVATNDAALRQRLRKAGRTVIYLRRSGALEISGELC